MSDYVKYAIGGVILINNLQPLLHTVKLVYDIGTLTMYGLTYILPKIDRCKCGPCSYQRRNGKIPKKHF